MRGSRPSDGGPPGVKNPVLILGNPVCLAAHGQTLNSVAKWLADVGVFADFEAIAPPRGEANTWPSPFFDGVGARLLAEGRRVLVAAGGDGTVHYVANLAAPTGLTLGILPLGTANDFARSLGLTANPVLAAHVIADAVPRAVDLGRVNGRWFLNAAHLGLGVEAARRTPRGLKRWLGPLAYVIGLIAAWRGAKPVFCTMCAEGQCVPLEATSILIGNGRYYGGGNVVAREASLEDGLFDVQVVAPDLGPGRAFWLAAAARIGTLGSQPDSLHFRTKRLTVELSGTAELNLDGELCSFAGTLDFEVASGCLSVLAPGLGGSGNAGANHRAGQGAEKFGIGGRP